MTTLDGQDLTNLMVKNGQDDGSPEFQRCHQIQWKKKVRKYTFSIYHVTFILHLSHPTHVISMKK